MENLQKLKTLKLTFVLLNFSLICSLFSCKQDKKETIGYGKMIYIEKCLSCHNYKSSSVSKISLLDMSNYDSLYLMQKLRALNTDGIHKDHLKDFKYSDNEINSISSFIISYSKPVNRNKDDEISK